MPAVIGPGFGTGERLRSFVTTLLGLGGTSSLSGGLVLDADALSSFAEDPETLFAAIRPSSLSAVLTPHEGNSGGSSRISQPTALCPPRCRAPGRPPSVPARS